MSFLTRKITWLPYASIARSPTTCARQFSRSSRLAALNESDHSQDDDHRKKLIDEHKDDQLDKQKRGEGHWKRELASNSENAVNADRHNVTDHDSHIEELQQQTTQASQEDHEHGKK